jgi:hypothetical protein
MIPVAVRDDPKLSPLAAIAYTHLQQIDVDKDELVCISLPRFAARLGVSRSTVAELMRELGNAGHIKRVSHDGRPGTYRLFTHPKSRTGARPESGTGQSGKPDGTHPENRTQPKLWSPKFNSPERDGCKKTTTDESQEPSAEIVGPERGLSTLTSDEWERSKSCEGHKHFLEQRQQLRVTA